MSTLQELKIQFKNVSETLKSITRKYNKIGFEKKMDINNNYYDLRPKNLLFQKPETLNELVHNEDDDIMEGVLSAFKDMNFENNLPLIMINAFLKLHDLPTLNYNNLYNVLESISNDNIHEFLLNIGYLTGGYKHSIYKKFNSPNIIYRFLDMDPNFQGLIIIKQEKNNTLLGLNVLYAVSYAKLKKDNLKSRLFSFYIDKKNKFKDSNGLIKRRKTEYENNTSFTLLIVPIWGYENNFIIKQNTNDKIHLALPFLYLLLNKNEEFNPQKSIYEFINYYVFNSKNKKFEDLIKEKEKNGIFINEKESFFCLNNEIVYFPNKMDHETFNFSLNNLDKYRNINYKF